MPATCTFRLNGYPTTVLTCPGIGAFPAFSGTGRSVNSANATGKPNEGPLPLGRYYIFGRGSGGLVTHIRDWVLKHYHDTDRTTWFALYRDDGSINDITFVNGVQRGQFRLHPVGPWHLSEGCVTLTNKRDFDKLAEYLHKQGPTLPTAAGQAYGIIEVTK